MRGSAALRASVAPGGVLAGPWVRNDLWRRARAVPSLDLRFADNKSLTDAVTGASLVTFIRNSNGTFVDSAGVLRSAVTNLLLRSEEFNDAIWGPVFGTVTANAETSPANTLTADKLIAANGGPDGQLALGATITSGATVTGSVYAKAGGFDRFQLFLLASNNTTPYGRSTFDPNTGVITTAAFASNGGTNASSAVQALRDGWYRFSVTVTYPAVTAAGIRLVVSNSDAANGDGIKGVFLWGAQLEQSATVGEYIPTTSAINSAPRFDHNPTTGESLGLLVEEQRTNLLQRSEEFDTTWSTSTASITANDAVAPNGATTADKLIVNSGSASGFISQSIAFTSGVTYTFSIYVKAAGITDFRIVLLATSFGASSTAVYNLSTGVVTSIGGAWSSASITAFKDGWYRVAGTATATATASSAARFTLQGTGDGSIGAFLWGAQLEAGAFPTSYIPTTTAAATRSADVASITGTAFSGWYSQSEGTVFTQYIQQPARASSLVAQLSDNSAANRIGFQDLDGTTPRWFQVRSNSSEGSAAGAARTAGAIVRHALRMKTNDFRAAYDGILTAQDSSIIPPTVSQLDIGKRETAVELLNGRISRLTFWPAGLTDPTLQQITQ